VLNATPQPLYPRERDLVPIVQEAGRAPAPVWTGAENLTHTEIRSSDRPARSKSLYRLSYFGSPTFIMTSIKGEVHVLNKHHAIKVYGEVEVKLRAFLNLALDGKE